MISVQLQLKLYGYGRALISADDNPALIKIYNNYPLLATSKTYQIKFKTYSGGRLV